MHGKQLNVGYYWIDVVTVTVTDIKFPASTVDEAKMQTYEYKTWLVEYSP